MLVEFTVGNYRSFRDRNTLSMVAAHITAENKSVDENNVIPLEDDLALLKSAAIYGANASGKSNLVSALFFAWQLVLQSSKETQAGEPIAVEPFALGTGDTAKPAFFEFVFLAEGTKYRYGFEATRNEVVSEWLSRIPRVKSIPLFERTRQDIQVSDKHFAEGLELRAKTRNNALFLSVAAQFNGPIASKVLGWFRNCNVISGLEDIGHMVFTAECVEDPKRHELIVDLVRSLDLNIRDLSVQKADLTKEALPKDMPDEIKAVFLHPSFKSAPRIRTLHHKYDDRGRPTGDVTFDLDNEESEGTKKLVALAGPIVDTLTRGKILIVDEFDARMHPIIAREIVGLFNSSETNPHGAQLVFTTQDTNLLDRRVFRRDQIWFTEKDRCEATHLHSLVEYKVRNDASFETNYIAGRYGAVPFVGRFGFETDGEDAQ